MFPLFGCREADLFREQDCLSGSGWHAHYSSGRFPLSALSLRDAARMPLQSGLRGELMDEKYLLLGILWKVFMTYISLTNSNVDV